MKQRKMQSTYIYFTHWFLTFDSFIVVIFNHSRCFIYCCFAFFLFNFYSFAFFVFSTIFGCFHIRSLSVKTAVTCLSLFVSQVIESLTSSTLIVILSQLRQYLFKSSVSINLSKMLICLRGRLTHTHTDTIQDTDSVIFQHGLY